MGRGAMVRAPVARAHMRVFLACVLMLCHGTQIRGLWGGHINPTGKSLLIRQLCKPRNQKYFPSPPTQIYAYPTSGPAPIEGRCSTSPNAGRDAVDRRRQRAMRAGRMICLQRTASRVVSGAPMPASVKPCVRQAAPVSQPAGPGRARSKPLKHARDAGVFSGVPVGPTRSCAFFMHARLGCIARPASCALYC